MLSRPSSVFEVILAIESSLLARDARLEQVERDFVVKELDTMHLLAGQFLDVDDLLVATSKKCGSLYTNPETLLERMHMVAGTGTLSSCQTSLPIVQALFHTTFVEDSGRCTDDLIVGRGHIAPAFYACRHSQGNFPLCAALAVHKATPAIVTRGWGFTNTVRHSLGEGLLAAFGRAYASPERQLVCFSGDGELNEGTCFEAIRAFYEHDLDNLTLVVDDNKFGIAQLAKPLNRKLLDAYFGEVIEIEKVDPEKLSQLIEHTRGRRTAIICHTQKGPHGFPPKDMPKGKKSCAQVGQAIKDVMTKNACSYHVATADLSSRFGFDGVLNYINVGLSEQLSVGMTLGLPEANAKFVLTDDKYLFNSLDALLSAFAAVPNLHIVAARKNETWGGHTTAPVVFNTILPGQVYEFVDPEDFERVLEHNIQNKQSGLYLMNDQPMSSLSLLRGKYLLSEERNVLIRKGKTGPILITTEATAVPVARVLEDHDDATHIRALTMRPNLVGLLDASTSQEVIVVEHNPPDGGLAHHVERTLSIKPKSVAACSTYDPPSDITFQRGLEVQLRELIQNGELKKCLA